MFPATRTTPMVCLALLCAAGCLAGLSGCASPYRDVTVGGLESEPSIGAGPRDPDPWSDWERRGPEKIRTATGAFAKSRWLDFWDMFEVGLSFGPWFRVEANYLIGFFGYGATDCARFRLGQRAMVVDEQNTMFSTLPFPVSAILYPVAWATGEPMAEIAALGGVSYDTETAIWPDPLFQGIPHSKDRMRLAFFERDTQARVSRVTGDSTAVGAEAHLLIGARVRVMPLQILDFLAGLVGLDPLKDDIKPFEAEKEAKGIK